MGDTYYTVVGTSEGQYKEKMSRFLSFACHVEDAEEAKAIIKRCQNEYHDSRHVCWAYMLGAARTEWQLNDNGEPSGTAGKPILGQINSFGLTDVIVLVVRYFGGIKLGTSGLIGAYREAARLALESAEIEEMHLKRELDVRCPYMAVDGVMRVIKGYGVKVLSQEFDNTCEFRIEYRMDMDEEIRGKIDGLSGVTTVIVEDGEAPGES